jgi:TPP-dependent pyruvate/acetoin dehydrogenase alpha subunit
VLTTELGFAPDELTAVDERVRREVDEATEIAELSGFPEPLDALVGIYGEPPNERPLWFREGVQNAVEKNERAEGWGTFSSTVSQEDA